MGKWLSELKVCRSDTGLTPGLGRAFPRALLLYVMLGLVDDLISFLPGQPGAELGGPLATIWQFVRLGTKTISIHLAGVLLLVSTMRPRTGYRGPHEWLSGTCVVSAAPQARRRLPQLRRVHIDSSFLAECPLEMGEMLGPFTLRGVLYWEHDRQILLAEDPALDRLIWIVLRNGASAPPPVTRQTLARATRPRWLTGNVFDRWRWDAYLAPGGCSLAELAGSRGLSWSEVRPILDDLVDELDAASRDGTLPEVLSVEEVWVQPDGRILLVDALATVPDRVTTARATDRMFGLVLRSAALALEGQQKRPEAFVTAIRAPVPRHAALLFDRLLGRGTPFENMAELRGVSRRPVIAHRGQPGAAGRPSDSPGGAAPAGPHHHVPGGPLVSQRAPRRPGSPGAYRTLDGGVLLAGALDHRVLPDPRRPDTATGGHGAGAPRQPPGGATALRRGAALVWLPIALLLAVSMLASHLVPSVPLLGLTLWFTARWGASCWARCWP